MKHLNTFIKENNINESKINKNIADKLAKEIVDLADRNSFFREYDPNSNSGDYEGMEYDEYIQKLTNIISQSIQDNGKDADAIWDDTCYDWSADPYGDYPDGCADEVIGYLKKILK